jgi:hypothetical protein
MANDMLRRVGAVRPQLLRVTWSLVRVLIIGNFIFNMCVSVFPLCYINLPCLLLQLLEVKSLVWKVSRLKALPCVLLAGRRREETRQSKTDGWRTDRFASFGNQEYMQDGYG